MSPTDVFPSNSLTVTLTVFSLSDCDAIKKQIDLSQERSVVINVAGRPVKHVIVAFVNVAVIK